MKKILIFIVLLISSCSQQTQKRAEKPAENPVEPSVGEISIIPQPASIKRLGGQFTLNRDTKIVATDLAGKKSATALNEILNENCGLMLDISDRIEQKNSIAFLTDSTSEGTDAEEGYNLKIEPENIQIKGTERGMFYAVQSLAQLFPSEITSEIKIPAAEITDAPRFPYRGMHLDSARHFLKVEFVKKYISLIAQYKYNYFHWHLTDDQGWRIEIKKYPKLTTIGSRRSETVRGKSLVGDGIPVEGFYTQEEIRDIVAYAESKNITIIPEIDLPGHSSAALASYPEYGCKTNYPYRVQIKWGGFPDIFCPTDKTFGFLEDVLGEVIDLFPNSPYIHIGGDEVMLDHWKESSFVQDLKKRENLKTEEEVHGWFFRKLAQFINSRGKKVIGWDEILATGVDQDTIVMTWRGVENGIQAARANHKVIMAPSDFTYFDHPQADAKLEPLSLGKPVTLEAVYKFDPIPPNIQASQESRNIIGGEGCIWTEFLKTPENIEYMAFPRVIALAEVLWTKQRKKDFVEFSQRLYKQFPRLDKASVNYRIPEPFGFQDRILSTNEQASVNLTSPIQNARIYYTLDGTDPNAVSNIYQAPFIINVPPNQTVELRAKIISPNGRESSVFISKYFRQGTSFSQAPQISGR